MKNFNADYVNSIIQLNAEPRAYIEIETDLGYSIFATTHAGILTVSAPDVLLDGVITSLTTASESITPEKGFSVLGGGSVGLLESQMTDALRDLYANQETIFNKKAHIYSGTADIAIGDYEKVQTLYVQDISNTDVSYSINLQTAQIFSNKKLFEVQTTELFKSFTSNETLTSIEVLSTDGFSLVEHDSQWQDSPSEEVGYLNFTGQDAEGNPVFEIVKYWSKDATKFYGDPDNGGKIQRSCFNTGRVTATGTSEGGSATEIREHIYIDLAAGKMILALLTGELYGQAGKTLPDGWHAGVDSSLVNITSLENIGYDLWNPSDDTGFHFYIDQPETSTAKTYIAREILRVASLAFLTDVNGEIKAKRFQQVIPNSGAQVYLDNNDILNKPAFDRKSSSIRNVFAVKWDYRTQLERFVRTEAFIDIDSINKNNVTSRAENIELKAVRNNSIEVNELLKTVTDGIRTRLTNPYIKPSIQSTFRRSLQLEAMDVIGLDLVGFSDYGASGDINRPFEIQEIQHDWLNRTVSMQVFGSTDPASPVNISETATTAVIDHTDWLPLESYLYGGFTNIAGVLTLTQDSTLGSVLERNLLRKYYYDGLFDLNGFTLTFYGTKVIDVDTIDALSSTFDGKGKGALGGSGWVFGANESTRAPVTAGYFGSYDCSEEGFFIKKFSVGEKTIQRRQKNASFNNKTGVSNVENFILNVDSNGKLNGLPDSLAGLAGSGGCYADNAAWSDSYGTITAQSVSGGAGGSGGAGLMIFANIFLVNPTTVIDLSGEDVTVVPTNKNISYSGTLTYTAGRGGSGWGGVLAVIIKDRSKPLASNADGIFKSVHGNVADWASPSLTRVAVSETKSTSKWAWNTDLLHPFNYPNQRNNTVGIDFAGSAFLSKYISAAEVTAPQVGRDVIAQVAAPQSLTLTPALDTPSTPDGNQITVTCNVVAPIDDNYSFTIFTYKNSTESAYYDTKYTVSNEASFTVTGNGKTYTVKAQSVSKQGVLGGYITENITVKNVLTEPAIEPEVTPQRVSGLRLRNSIASNVQDKFKSGNAEFLWNAVSRNNSVQFGQEGLLGASSGGYDAWFKDYQVNIYDESAVLLRTEFTKSESYTYTLEKNKTDSAGREFFIQVLSRGQLNQVSEGVLFKVENPAPAAVTSLSAKVGYNSIQVDFVSPNDIDYKGVNMRFRKIGLAWSAALFVAGTSCNVANLEGATDYEIELTTVDEFGVGTATSITATTVDINAEQVSGLSAWATETDPVDTAFLVANMEGASISEALLGSGSVTNAKLGALAVDSAKLANSAVTSTKIANLAVGTAAINDLAVTSAKIQSLVASKISAGQVDVAVDIGTGVKLDGTTGTVKTINSGFGTILGTADGAWNQLPNPTVITSIDTTTDTQTFGVDTAGNAIIGQGDNAVTFIAGKIGFGANVTIGTNTNQTVTVGAGGDFATLNLALESLSKIVPAYKSGGFTAEISILSGHVIEEKIEINGVDLSFITITSVGAQVEVDISTLGNFIFVYNGGKSPLLKAIFKDISAVIHVGVAVDGFGSTAYFHEIGGLEDFSEGIYASNDSFVYMRSITITNSTQMAITVLSGSTVIADNAIIAGGGNGLRAEGSSFLSIYRLTATNLTGNLMYIHSSKLYAVAADFSGWTGTAQKVRIYSSNVDMTAIDLSSPSSFVSYLIDTADSDINLKNSDLYTSSDTVRGTILSSGSNINLIGANGANVILSDGTIVKAKDSTNTVFTVTINTLTASGIVFK